MLIFSFISQLESFKFCVIPLRSETELREIDLHCLQVNRDNTFLLMNNFNEQTAASPKSVLMQLDKR